MPLFEVPDEVVDIIEILGFPRVKRCWEVVNAELFCESERKYYYLLSSSSTEENREKIKLEFFKKKMMAVL